MRHQRHSLPLGLVGTAILAAGLAGPSVAAVAAPPSEVHPGGVHSGVVDPGRAHPSAGAGRVAAQPSAFVAQDVVAHSATDVLAVGALPGDDSVWQVERFDGSAWTTEATGAPYSYLRAVTEIGGDTGDAWAVGRADQARALAVHYDGTSWQRRPIARPGTWAMELTDVSGVASDDVWAVGSHETDSSVKALVEHWDGSTWSLVQLPRSVQPVGGLEAVTAVATDDVWAVSGGAILHWDGATWSVSLREPLALTEITAVSADDIWAVGGAREGGQASTEHWDGSSWSSVPVRPHGGASFLDGVDATSSSDVWAVGGVSAADGGHLRTLVEHWDGGSWSRVATPNNVGQTFLSAVSADSSTDAWAVGREGTRAQDGLLLHYTGHRWVRAG